MRLETGNATATNSPTASLGIAGQPAGRLASIDIFRGLTMAVMIFVNDLDSVKGLPWWTYHRGQVNGMTYVDMVFPAFLFIVGMAIPIAIRSRLAKNPSQAQLWIHVLLRSFSLIVLGLILANASKGNGAFGVPSNWWAFTALLGALLFWNVYPRDLNPKLARFLKFLGFALLIAMFAIFRRTTEDGHVAWIDDSYWEILGIIGWAYLSACILYIPTKKFSWAPAGWLLLLLTLNVFCNAHWLTWPSHVRAYIWPFGAGDSCLIIMAGVVTAHIFLPVANTLKRKLVTAVLFGAICFAAGWLLSPLGISKIKGTPTWCLYCIAASVAIYVALFLICDRKGWTNWAWLVRPAGSNTLTTYLLPDLFYFAVAGTLLDAPFEHGWPGVVRAIVFTIIMLLLARAVTNARIRMQL